MRRFWINTEGARQVQVSLTSTTIDKIVPAQIRLLFKMKECTAFEYFMFDVFKVNLKVKKEDRYKWLKSFFQTHTERFIASIVMKLYRLSHKNQ